MTSTNPTDSEAVMTETTDTAETPKLWNLLVELTKDLTLPDGCDSWGIRSVHPDLRSSRGYRWPFPGQTAVAPGPIIESNTDGCPDDEGDGICLAHSWRGMASGGISAATLLLCAYAASNVLGCTEDQQKFRVRECVVVELVDGGRLLREGGRSADLSSANLRSADLSSADLSSADLRSANLRYADVSSADLSYANLSSANLSSADLSSANLSSADVSSANLSYANLSYANLRSADLSSADLRSANLRYADVSSADLSSADLRSADLRYANLRYADLRSAPAANDYTICPTGYVVENGLLVRAATVQDQT